MAQQPNLLGSRPVGQALGGSPLGNRRASMQPSYGPAGSPLIGSDPNAAYNRRASMHPPYPSAPQPPTYQLGGQASAHASQRGSISYTPSMAGSPFASSNASQARPAPANPDAPIEKIRAISSKMEDYLELFSQPIKPYLPGLGRFLIVVTFLEDALRITTQWSEQTYYLNRHRHFPKFLAYIFLALNVAVMFAGSGLVITKRFPEIAVAGLLCVVVAQGLGYGLITDLNFFLRNLSVIGGLLMVLSDSWSQASKKIFAGIPSMSETDRKHYFQLAGRVLMIFLFLGFILNGQMTILRAFVALVGLAACIMVAVGFKAKRSATVLVLILSTFNVFVNSWWTLHKYDTRRDFQKYDFWQTLSVVGGLLLLVNQGPGGYSVDEKKKVF
ncbi:hypothetical protein E5Q_01182 [Mixia osmundae IAM 14324]|uniref:Surfeit locus protein 4 n=1 Tax=Mixia osmundae (strain CBS 9802 / IAM 14324 / JCM 22182 / KY 12970) TaxID=764103 RepID=G7DVC0_MIXOS|nr:hypothetical protein E5Q_01182 [Mixia osmundae IAM 14324]